jgi:hypothetical protein
VQLAEASAPAKTCARATGANTANGKANDNRKHAFSRWSPALCPSFYCIARAGPQTDPRGGAVLTSALRDAQYTKERIG